MAHPLRSAHRKIAHARNHLKVLDGETRAFVESNPYGYRVDVDDKGVGHVRFDRVPEIPHRSSLIAGDVVHNLRSALDHVVYRLALLNHGTGERNAFPIFDDPTKYRDNESRLLKDVIKDHRARIEALQPYHVVIDLSPRRVRREFEVHAWLGAIGRLDNIDKHRLLLASSAVAPLRSPRFEGVRYARGEWAGEGWIRVEKGAELFTITELEPLGDPREVKVNPNPPFTIGFGDATAADLRMAARAVEHVVGSFVDAF